MERICISGPKILLVTSTLLLLFLTAHQISYITSPTSFPLPFDTVTKCVQDTKLQTLLSANESDAEIPPIIHQIWKSTDLSTYPTQTFHDHWKYAAEPLNYTVKLWTDKDLVNLLQSKYPWLESTYHSYSHNVQRADLMRLVVVHAEGGVYADLDVFPRSMEELDCLRRLPGVKFAPTGGNRGLSNHMFMAPAGHPFIWWALTEAKRRGGTSSRRILLPYLRVFWSTGPLMVTEAYRQYADMFGSQEGSPVLLDESYGRTVFGHAAGRSWHGSDGQLLNFVADHVGMGAVFMGLGFVTSLLGTILLGKRLRRRYSKQLRRYIPMSRQY